MTTQELRQLDAECAVRIFGWKPETRKEYAGIKNCKGYGLNTHLNQGHLDRDFCVAESFPTRRCTTDPAAAFEVLKRCCVKLGEEAERCPAPEWLPVECKWRVVESDTATGIRGPECETLELAIVKFALKLFPK